MCQRVLGHVPALSMAILGSGLGLKGQTKALLCQAWSENGAGCKPTNLDSALCNQESASSQYLLRTPCVTPANILLCYVILCYLSVMLRPPQVKRLLQPGKASSEASEPGMCLFDLLMGIEVLQAPLLDLLLDVLLQLCRQQPKAKQQSAGRVRRQGTAGSGADPAASLAAAYSRCICDKFATKLSALYP